MREAFFPFVASDIPFIKKAFEKIDKNRCFFRFDINNNVYVFLHVSADISNFSNSINCINALFGYAFDAVASVESFFNF